MKRWLALLLTCLLTVPFSLLPQMVSAESDRVLADTTYTVALKKTIPNSGLLVSNGKKFTAVDLSAYDMSKLALEMDVLYNGDVDGVKQAAGATVELTSSGESGKQSLTWSAADWDWKKNEWFRVSMPLDQAVNSDFNLARVNYVRLAIIGLPDAMKGKQVTFRVCNVRVVDTTVAAPADDRIGDGTPPELIPNWQIVESEYPTNELVVAGFDLSDFMQPNTDEDATTLIQSLLDKLFEVGGGTLYIPEGEYVLKGKLLLQEGVTISGDWRAPTAENPQATGTILKAYYGRGMTEDTTGNTSNAFITLSPNSSVENLTIWYPEQDPENIVPYPVSILLYDPTSWGKDYTHVRNMTFINSYKAVKQGPEGSGCPNIHNVYGTPLYNGAQLDGIADVGRFDYMFFSPFYWENCGLPGAPTTDAAKKALEDYLIKNATGIMVQRVDWSYFAFSRVEGYLNGMYFAESVHSPGSYSNGQCYDMTFVNCDTGILFEGIANAGELFAKINIDNCRIGIRDYYHKDIAVGNMELSYITIDATETAIWHQGTNRMIFFETTVENGDVISEHGPLVMSACDFKTAAPQITLPIGATGGIFHGNTAEGDFKVSNPGLAPVTIDEKPLKTPDIDFLTAEQAEDKFSKPARNVLYLADLDATQKTDVTAALQELLDKAGKEGGGVVFIPGGRYRMDGSVTVPSGVELRGAVNVGRNPFKTGTILEVYGKTGDPTVVLSANSGAVGLVFDYPVQGNSIDDLEEYPYALQGRGENVYMINIALRNAYNGIDLMTYRCDNHYVRYMAGFCFNNAIKIGGGSKNGVVSNYQMNSSAWLNGAESKYGSWENSPREVGDGSNPDAVSSMQKATELRDLLVQKNCHSLIVGDVTDQILYDNFTYIGARGAIFVEENGKGASGWNVGNAYDYTTTGIEIQALDDMDFINVQIVSYNYTANFGSDVIHQIYTNEKFDGEVNFVNVACWAQPTSFVRVDGGKVNIYNSNYDSRTKSNAFMSVKDGATLYMQNGALYSSGLKLLMTEDSAHDALTMNGFYYENTMSDMSDIEGFTSNQKRLTAWNVPTNAVIDPEATMIFTETFDDYPVQEEPVNGVNNAFGSQGSFSKTSAPDAGVNVTLVRTGSQFAARLYMTADKSSVSMNNDTIVLDSGSADSLYHFETRVNIGSMCSGEYSQFYIAAYNIAGTIAREPMQLVVFNGKNEVQVDGKTLTTWEKNTWYRVGIEIDLRDQKHKTYRVYLFDDEYNVIAISGLAAFDEGYQDNDGGVGHFSFEGLADSAAASNETITAMVEYCYISGRDQSSFPQAPDDGKRGDVNGDGSVDSSDARMILQASVNKITLTDSQQTVADVNGDQTIDSSDARMVLQAAVGKITL